MSAKCGTCQFFEMNEKHPDKEGVCEIKQDFYLPSGYCKAYLRIDADQPELEFQFTKEDT